ncbi:PAS domain S-box protein [Leptospira kanakyensis]|uniref:histidine kinase n=2 Tax=Leptospira kanakyensis TaxID=2484968 RepID=A0A6N4Q4Z7_9LEPT|nr:ATP-binding protein [Leptospira kanakyensis]TGK48013.1 PAS domain S-box protein [Leptospira kanakyensis]TGK64340.1 PAS domain S-box protein [Leptospira kanakyensis]TGK66770.1 PAS domain S-box protein [Leptospira kanakyensis]
MLPFEVNVIFAVTVISVVFNTSMAIIIYFLSKQSRSEVRLGYTAIFLAVLVFRNFSLFLFGDGNEIIFFFFSESCSIFGSYLLIAAVFPIASKRIHPSNIYFLSVFIYVLFVSFLLTDLSFFWKALPSSVFNASALILFGIIVFSLDTYPKVFRIFFLTVCLIIAAQRITFPYLFSLEWYRPIGYIINTLFMFLFGVGCILFNFNIQTNKLNLSLGELELLQKTVKDVNVRLLIMYNQLPAIIYNIEFLPEPRTSYISPKMEEITGYGLSYFYDNTDFFKDIVIPEDQHKISELYAGNSPIILRMIHANGSLIWTEHYVNVSFDILGIEKRIDVVALDITKSKKTEISLLQEKNLNTTVFDNAANLILLTDAKGLIESINSATESILGLRKNEVIGNYIQDVILLPEDRDYLKAVLDDVNEIQKIAESLILRCVTTSNRILYLEWRLGIIRDNRNEPSKIIWIGIDQTSKRSAEIELKELNKSLEEKVKARTKELQASNFELNSALFALREAQQKLIQNEKMVSLGQLVSGLAHEINNPIGMIKSSVETLISEWEEEKIHESSIRINELIQFILDTDPGGLRILTGLSNRQARKSMVENFKIHSVPLEGELAELFVDSGIRNLSNAVITKIKAVIRNHEDFQILRRLLLVKQSSEHILYSVKRLSKITYTLKNFAGLQSNLELSDYSLSDTIHSAVSLYKEHFLRDINLILNLEYSGNVRCIQGDLVQLWSQIIWNSIQAVAAKGTLQIRSFKRSEVVYIEIEDSGIGIPQENHSKIFMPFFSTKTTGDGLGLGLYLVKEIANRHNANVEFESMPGRTIFKVRFPLTT